MNDIEYIKSILPKLAVNDIIFVISEFLPEIDKYIDEKPNIGSYISVDKIPKETCARIARKLKIHISN